MSSTEPAIFVLLLVLGLGLVIPELLKKFRLPFITLIILTGAIFGPNGFKYVGIDSIVEFFGFLGMTFLMLMAGLATDITKVKNSIGKILILAGFNGIVPFVVGFFITKLFGYSISTSVLIGIVFISSSVAIIVPSLRNNKKISDSSLQLILSSVLVADILSLIALGVVFQNASKITSLPLPLYFSFLILFIIALLYLLPKITKYAQKKGLFKEDGYEKQLRFTLIILIGTLVFLGGMGVHPILAAFLAGLSLSGLVAKDKSGLLQSKLHTLGYGLFVPVFFFVVGMEMDIGLLLEFDVTNLLMIALISGLIISKFGSGYIGGKIVGLTKKESLVFGSISITQLTTTLAVTYAASSIGLLDTALVTSIIMLSLVTTFLGPTMASYFSNKSNRRS